MRIYTKTGDAGETGLFDGTRVSKADPRVDAYGDVDELNAWLGVARAQAVPADIGEALVQIQRDLFALGALLADPRHRIAARVEKATLGEDDIARLEKVDRPARSVAAAAAAVHPGRRLARGRDAAPRPHRLPPGRAADGRPRRRRGRSDRRRYLNRLSDLLFVMARAVNSRAGADEIEW